MSQDFNPRPPWGGRRDLSQRNKVAFLISIHALRGEGDDDKTTAAKLRDDFNPRPPWGGRPPAARCAGTATKISIHALRGEGDKKIAVYLGKRDFISIHALRGEGDVYRRY